MIESYSILTVVCLINLIALDWSQAGITFISCSAIVGSVICLLFPFISSIWLLSNFKKLKEEEFLNSYGAFYEGMSLTLMKSGASEVPDKKIVLLYQFWFLLRRLILGFLVVLCREVLFYQFFGLIMSTVLL